MDGDNIPLSQTTDTAVGNMRTVRKRLSDGSTKIYNYSRPVVIKKHIELTFANDSEKVKFEKKCEEIRLALGYKSLKDVLLKVIANFSTNRPTHDPATAHHQQTLTIPSAADQVNATTSQIDEGDPT